MTQVAWESRKGHGRYYTRTRNVRGRFVREYLGCGPRAQEAAAQDERRRAERAAEVERRRAALARVTSVNQLLRDLFTEVDLLARVSLTAAGYRQHDRGSWRKTTNGKRD
jgi:hypothetical protein